MGIEEPPELTEEEEKLQASLSALVSRVMIAEVSGAPQTAARVFAKVTEHVSIESARRLVAFEKSVWEVKQRTQVS